MKLILDVILTLLAVPLAGGLLAGADRKITARMQRRRGPPLLQPFYDVAKLLGKESLAVSSMTRLYVALFLFFNVFAVLLFFVGQDILLCVFAFTLSCVFFAVAGYSSHSPYSFEGTERELLQIMCYEPMMLIAAFGYYKVAGSFEIAHAFALDKPIIIKLPLIFLGLLYVLTIKLRKSPFDLSMSHHGHQEIVKGITTEMSGGCLAMVEIAHWFESVFALAFVYLFFVYSAPASWATAVVVCLLVYFLEIVVDNTFARFKWRLALQSSWLVVGATSVTNFIILKLM